MAHDEAHAYVTKAGGAEVVAGEQQRGCVFHCDAFLYGQLTHALSYTHNIMKQRNHTVTVDNILNINTIVVQRGGMRRDDTERHS